MKAENHVYIPKTYEDAMNFPDWEEWKSAIDSEISSLKNRGTFSAEVPKPKSGCVTSMFVFDIKTGFFQKHGINYDETFAPTLRYNALRIFLATAAKHNWKIHQMDVVTAFLAGKLKEKVYLQMPRCFWPTFGKFVQVLMSLYGLKQAAAVWYNLLKGFLVDIGFNPVPTDPSVFINQENSVQVNIGVYVDDLLIAGGNEDEIIAVKEKLSTRFGMKDLGEARNVLGIRIRRKENMLAIDQSKYALEIIEEFLADNAAAYDTPMDPNALNSLYHQPGEPITDVKHYLRILGKLQFLCNTRPDISFAVGRCGSWSAKPCKNHLKALYRILGYISTTIQYGIVYGTEYNGVSGVQSINNDAWNNIDYYSVDHNIEAFAGCFREGDTGAFTDADGGMDPKDRKVIQGHV
ncbi:hypothetical protein K3495_g10933 [Podosphaera aphanis]|nr:hypothetical protein K3495_g10933 [Podosphaera aphanis]